MEDLERYKTQGYPHKLPRQAATIMPYLPLGPALFGPNQSQFEGTFSPDVVAFIFLEHRLFFDGKRGKLGPRLFFLDQLQSKLEDWQIRGLKEHDFRIEPDRSMGRYPVGDDRQYSNPFGTVNQIGLFGERQNGAKYMRINRNGQASSLPQVGRDPQGCVNGLNNVIDNLIATGVAKRMELGRGDVLLVNNRRVATAWDQKCTFQYRYRRWRGGDDHIVKPLDRMIFQMNFYYPEKIEPEKPLATMPE